MSIEVGDSVGMETNRGTTTETMMSTEAPTRTLNRRVRISTASVVAPTTTTAVTNGTPASVDQDASGPSAWLNGIRAHG